MAASAFGFSLLLFAAIACELGKAERVDAYVLLYKDIAQFSRHSERFLCGIGAPPFLDSSDTVVLAAHGTFADTIQINGWSELTIITSVAISDEDQAYAGGFLEGCLTTDRTYEMAMNVLCDQLDCRIPDEDSPLHGYLMKQHQWMTEQIKQNPDDPYWFNVHLVLRQMDGLLAGYNEYAIRGRALSFMDILVLNAQADLLDLVERFPYRSKPTMRSMRSIQSTLFPLKPPRNRTQDSIEQEGEEVPDEDETHCSALIKVLPDGSDILIAHNTWSNYADMLRVYKHYHFNFHNLRIKAKLVSLSGYPGTLSSVDDFYVANETKLVVTETTNSIWNETLKDMWIPQSIPTWLRSIFVTRMADSGREWSQLFSLHNSGTYTNQFMIVDLKKFKPGKPLQNDLLWVIEVEPGNATSADVTDRLRQNGYWASYNIPYFSNVYEGMGYPSKALKKKTAYSYTSCPRAQLFAREQATIFNTEDMKRVIRLNRFMVDPLAKGNPTWAIASRADLKGINKTVTHAGKKHASAFGAIDGKVTSFKSQMLEGGVVHVVSGPTADDLPPFEWTDEWRKVSAHYGHPAKFDFDWVSFAMPGAPSLPPAVASP
eukprot:GILK01001216.1.p1 GENE.GILK01001216.1~~GILK01001216.1.p1  ORF type:complete len:615 (-),score=92.05 GILK01001216.1:69-1868(-)